MVVLCHFDLTVLTSTRRSILFSLFFAVFRDAMSTMVDDCFSRRFDLLLPCPNASAAGELEDGDNVDKYLPNPRYASGHPRALPMYDFLGKLMGMSLRLKLVLAFEMPPIIWKALVGQPISWADLRAIDAATADHLAAVAGWEPPSSTSDSTGGSSGLPVLPPSPQMAPSSPGMQPLSLTSSSISGAPPPMPLSISATGSGRSSAAPSPSPVLRASMTPLLRATASSRTGTGTGGGASISRIDTAGDAGGVAYSAAAAAAFSAAFPGLTFSTRSLDGRTVELVPGGASIPVTLLNRHAYVHSMLQHHTSQYDPLVRYIRRGLYSVVPARAVRLLTWQELEVAVAGRPEIDVKALRQHTDYEGYRRDDPVITLFWRVFESFSNEDRSLFIRFVWGRSRLPVGKRWPKRMKIQRRPCSEEQLPLAHTCFFSVELPPYQTEARMREALLAAIHYGAGILNA